MSRVLGKHLNVRLCPVIRRTEHTSIVHSGAVSVRTRSVNMYDGARLYTAAITPEPRRKI